MQNAVFRDITKQISTVSLDQPLALGQHYTTSGHNFSVLTSAPVNICIISSSSSLCCCRWIWWCVSWASCYAQQVWDNCSHQDAQSWSIREEQPGLPDRGERHGSVWRPKRDIPAGRRDALDANHDYHWVHAKWISRPISTSMNCFLAMTLCFHCNMCFHCLWCCRILYAFCHVNVHFQVYLVELPVSKGPKEPMDIAGVVLFYHLAWLSTNSTTLWWSPLRGVLSSILWLCRLSLSATWDTRGLS